MSNVVKFRSKAELDIRAKLATLRQSADANKAQLQTQKVRFFLVDSQGFTRTVTGDKTYPPYYDLPFYVSGGMLSTDDPMTFAPNKSRRFYLRSVAEDGDALYQERP